MFKMQRSGVIEVQKGGGMSIWLSNVGPCVGDRYRWTKPGDRCRMQHNGVICVEFSRIAPLCCIRSLGVGSQSSKSDSLK